MRLFPRSFLQGVTDALIEKGAMQPFATDDLAFSVFDKVAEEFQIPAMIDMRQLPPKEVTAAICGRIKEASDYCVSVGKGPGPLRIANTKTASARTTDPRERAWVTSRYLMNKTAEEGASLNPVEQNTPESAARTDTIGATDLRNRPDGAYENTNRGTTQLPTPGVIGREVGGLPGAPSTGAQVKTSGIMDNPRIQSLISSLRSGASRMAQNPMEHAYNAYAGHNLGNQERAKFQRMAEGGFAGPQAMDRQQAAIELALSRRNEGLKGLATQGGAALVGAGAIGAGVHAARGGGGDGPPDPYANERLASLALGGQKTASDAMVKTATFLAALNNTLPDGYVPSPTALVGAAGLGENGDMGVRKMAQILEAVKTAEDAEAELAQVLQVLSDNGIPPSPELIQELTSAMDGVEPGESHNPPGGAVPGGGAGPGGAPPAMGEGETGKEAGMRESATKAWDAVKDKAGKGRASAGAAASRAGDWVKEHAGKARETAGKGVEWGKAHKRDIAEGVGAVGLAAGAGAIGHAVGKRDKEKNAEYWDRVLKSAGAGSLNPVEPNTETSAAKDDTIAKTDLANRALGKYENKARGTTELSTTAGEVGSQKKAEEDAWIENLVKCAEQWDPALPADWNRDQRYAAIEKIASLPPHARQSFVLAQHVG